MSPAPYAHQWHTKPSILGLNLSPALMLFSPPCKSHPAPDLPLEGGGVAISLPSGREVESMSFNYGPRIIAVGLLHVFRRRVNLGEQLFVGKVL